MEKQKHLGNLGDILKVSFLDVEKKRKNGEEKNPSENAISKEVIEEAVEHGIIKKAGLADDQKKRDKKQRKNESPKKDLKKDVKIKNQDAVEKVLHWGELRKKEEFLKKQFEKLDDIELKKIAKEPTIFLREDRGHKPDDRTIIGMRNKKSEYSPLEREAAREVLIERGQKQTIKEITEEEFNRQFEKEQDEKEMLDENKIAQEIRKGKFEEGAIVERRIMMDPKSSMKNFLGSDKVRPSINFYFGNQPNGIPTFIKFPVGAEGKIQDLTADQQPIPTQYLRLFKSEKTGEYNLIGQFDLFEGKKPEGEKITQKELENKIKNYKALVKQRLEYLEAKAKTASKDDKEKIKKFITTIEEIDLEREILSFMVPDGRLLEWEDEIWEGLGEEASLENDEIKGLILEKTTIKEMISVGKKRQEKILEKIEEMRNTKIDEIEQEKVNIGQERKDRIKKIRADAKEWLEKFENPQLQEMAQEPIRNGGRGEEDKYTPLEMEMAKQILKERGYKSEQSEITPEQLKEKKIKEKIEEWKKLNLMELQALKISEDDKVGQEMKMQIVEQKIDEYLQSKQVELIQELINKYEGKSEAQILELVERIKVNFRKKQLEKFM